MKFTLLLVLAALLTINTSRCAVPQLIHYQGFLTDSLGAPLDSTVLMSFQLYDDATGGSIHWNEMHPAVAVNAGLFHVLLGETSPIPYNVFSAATLFLGVAVGEDPEMIPRILIASNGYAYRVSTIDGATGGTIIGGLTVNGNVSISGRTDHAGVASVQDSMIANGNAVFNSTLVANNLSSFNDSTTISGAALINGPVTIDGKVIVENAADTTFLFSNAGHTEGVFLPTGSSCWQPIDTSEQCGGAAAPITSVNGLSGGTITSDLTISGKLNVGGSSNLNPGTQALVSGSNNRARGNYSTVGGGGGALLSDSNAANGVNSTVAGGRRNLATGQDCFVGGGSQGSASGIAAAVVGGLGVKARGDYSFVGGGGGLSSADSNYALSHYSFVGGGNRNGVGTSGSPLGSPYGVIVGGRNNIVTDSASIVVGGLENSVSGDTAFVGGGYSNSSSGDQSVICGGFDNTISSAGEYAFIGGGNSNTANGSHATNVGGQGNTANGSWAANGGGFQNIASGAYAAIPGGWGNTASGRYAVACGRFAQATHAGSFVWSDTTGSFTSQGENTFAVRATNGVFMYTSATLGARLNAGSSVWTAISDSTQKRNIRSVNTANVLESVVNLPIKQWSYKTQDPSIEHVGPMAQDFWNEFRLGDDSLSISTVDPSGIALAAIQELVKQNELMRGEIRQLRSDVVALKAEKSASMVRNESGK